MNKLNVKKGDTVVVISGKDKGKQGKILRAAPKDERVVVQGANMITKHVKPRRQGEAGGRIEQEGTLHVSNVKLVCPKCNKPTRVGYQLVADGDKQKKVRVCKECGKVMD